MEGEVLSRRQGMKSGRSRSFSGLLGGYPSISQGPGRRFWEASYEEGEDSVEEEESEKNEVAASLAGAPGAPQAQDKALSNQPLVSQAETNFLKMMEQIT
ncbi:hypothetical protein O181_023045 [Austropuccinia psidii MF-1]|uniref:Uncharacterized protein n=1 Tax=Austropuccinia psidii MF-1 TaxID=1389203 RepID=A0A9Q3CIH3_9BASI|nr:hypothetical protein [Austropuccinia psidii MF-1]